MVALSLKVFAAIDGGVVPCMITCEQLKKAQTPMLVTLLGMVIKVREVQLAKAELPMLVTLLGMVIEVRERQL